MASPLFWSGAGRRPRPRPGPGGLWLQEWRTQRGNTCLSKPLLQVCQTGVVTQRLLLYKVISVPYKKPQKCGFRSSTKIWWYWQFTEERSGHVDTAVLGRAVLWCLLCLTAVKGAVMLFITVGEKLSLVTLIRFWGLSQVLLVAQQVCQPLYKRPVPESDCEPLQDSNQFLCIFLLKKILKQCIVLSHLVTNGRSINGKNENHSDIQESNRAWTRTPFHLKTLWREEITPGSYKKKAGCRGLYLPASCICKHTASLSYPFIKGSRRVYAKCAERLARLRGEMIHSGHHAAGPIRRPEWNLTRPVCQHPTETVWEWFQSLRNWLAVTNETETDWKPSLLTLACSSFAPKLDRGESNS